MKKNSASLMKGYHRLPELEKNIVQIAALAGNTCNMGGLMSILRQSNHCIKETPTLYSQCNLLRKQGLLANNFECNRQISEKVVWDLLKSGQFDKLALSIQKELPNRDLHIASRQADYCWNEYQKRDLRIAIYRQQHGKAAALLKQGYCHFGNIISVGTLDNIFEEPEAGELWQTSSPTIKNYATAAIMYAYIAGMAEVPEKYRQWCQQNLDAPLEQGGWLLRDHFLMLSLLRGELDLCLDWYRRLGDKIPAYEQSLALALHAFWQNDIDKSLALFESALRQYRQMFKLRTAFMPDFAALFYLVALFKRDGERVVDFCTETAYRVVKWKEKYDVRHNNLWRNVQTLIWHLGCRMGNGIDGFNRRKLCHTPLETFLTHFLLHCLIEQKYVKPEFFAPAFASAVRNGYRWVALECARLLQAQLPHETYQDYIAAHQASINTVSLATIFNQQPPWEKTVREILQILQPACEQHDAQSGEQSHRIIWHIGQQGNTWIIECKEQKRRATSWTSGRFVKVEGLVKKEVAYATAQDCSIASQILQGERNPFAIGGPQARARMLLRMIGHPLVFDFNGHQMEIVKGHPELVSEVVGEQLHIKFNLPEDALQEIFSPPPQRKHFPFSFYDVDQQMPPPLPVVAYLESPHRWKVFELTPEQHKIAKLIGDKGLFIPLTARAQAMEALTRMSSLFVVQSAIDDTGNLPEIAADTHIYVHVSPRNLGFKVEFWVKPAGDEYFSFKPNTGREITIAEIGREKVKIRRQLVEEKQNAEAIMRASEVLSACEPVNWEWQLSGIEECLTMLDDLQNLPSAKICWPEGEKIKIAANLDLQQLKLRIVREQDWFSVSGQLQVDEERVLDMKRLIELLQQTPGRFVLLEGNAFIAVTEKLRRQLQDLSGMGDLSGEGVRVHPLAAGAIEELAGKVGECESDDEWRRQLERIAQLGEISPELPSTLQTTLRTYQMEGFIWLCRLAHWGVGACLADDMGLGKTIEALAILLHRAADGPALVVAPTSVCFNWIEEARRFAPTLRMILFREQEREKVMSELKPFDCLVVSYGLLHNESELLCKTQWHTVVLDEAQAIKNFTTKRSQAAMNLSGKFKMVTTGTPIENHLSELWNLFRFLNPGLLGSLEKFNQRFALPIERDHDMAAQKRLKRLIQPFILRRTKTQVLEELPARTEITLHVDLTADEQAFYEALRRQALENLSSMEGSAGQQHLRILAEIMKLRRACCHTKLVRPGSDLPCSKLELFAKVVDELLENKHKVLVFSQFVDYLNIVRKQLDAQNVSYQYLDGSTPQPERKKCIEAFQAGQGDIFLLSLKAGGLGINLTAADYVIHLDPWWNPAVEDQAADRAHRIGQERPVTIYRLVTRNTIEEKIIELHKEKRDLASSLLSGAEINNKITAEQLLAIIRER